MNPSTSMFFYDPSSGDLLGNMATSDYYYMVAIAGVSTSECHRLSLALGDGQQDIVKMFGVHGGAAAAANSSSNVIDTRHRGRLADSPMHHKQPISKSASYQLKKARALAARYRASNPLTGSDAFLLTPDVSPARGITGGGGSLDPSAHTTAINYSEQLQYLSKVNRTSIIKGANSGSTRVRAQALAGDDDMLPSEKLELVREQIQRLTSLKQHNEEDGEEGTATGGGRGGSGGARQRDRRHHHKRHHHSQPQRKPVVNTDILVDWELLNEYLIIQLALCRLMYGDWSMEAANAELELCVSYIALQQPLVARDHAEAARKAAQAVLERDPLIEVKIDTAEATAIVQYGITQAVMDSSVTGAGSHEVQSLLSHGVHLASRAAATFAKIENLDPSSPRLFPHYYLRACAMMVEGTSHQRALDALDDALRCCANRPEPHWSDVFYLHTAKLLLHFQLLARCTQELLAIPAKSSREKLHAELSQVTTKDQLSQLHNQLTNDLSALSEKRKSLQLTLVRQCDYVKGEIENALQKWLPAASDYAALRDLQQRDPIQGEAEAAGNSAISGNASPSRLLPVAKVLHAVSRAMWIGQKIPLARKLSSFAAELLSHCVGAEEPSTIQVSVDRAILMAEGTGVPSTTFLDSWQQYCFPITEESGTVEGSLNVSRARYSGLLKALTGESGGQHLRRKKIRAASDSDRSDESSSDDHYSDDNSEDEEGDPSAVEAMRREGCQLLEVVLRKVCAHFGPTSVTAHQISCSLEKAYAKLVDTHHEVCHTALLCDIYATLLGPTHPKTLSKLTEFERKRGKVHAPLFSPSWGVLNLLSQVTLSTATPGADIYFTTSGEAPTEDQGVHQSQLYIAPIVLDTYGRVTIKAFAVRDGKRSGVVEARYTVMKQ